MWKTLALLFFFFAHKVFHKTHGLSLITGPNKTTVAYAGSNETFTWKLKLSAETKSKELKAQFGPWDKQHRLVYRYLITFIRNSSGEETEIKEDDPMAQRLFWVGDLARNDYVAFQLNDVQHQDAGTYGIRFRVDYFPPDELETWFSLKVEDPPVKPTADPRNITLDVVKGQRLNITCRIIMEGEPNVLWMRDNIPVVHSGQSKLLFVESVNKSHAGNYVCASITPNGNTTSPITTVNVLYAPSIHATNKLVSVNASKEVIVRLKCEADGNPPATFYWHKNSVLINKGFNNTWNSSTLTIVPTKDEDFARYVCTAWNKVGWDAMTFVLYENEPPSITKRSKNKVTVLEGNPLLLFCEAKGYPSPHITWSKNGKLLPSSDNGTRFIIHETSKKDAGVYRCEASNSVGTVEYSCTVEITSKAGDRGNKWTPLTIALLSAGVAAVLLLVGCCVWRRKTTDCRRGYAKVTK